MTDKKIARALIDFSGHLTERLDVDVTPLLEEWAKARGIELKWSRIDGDEVYTSIKEVCSIANAPTVRVLWGDNTITEVSIIHQAELVHRMGLGMPTKKFGDEPVEKSA